VAHAVSTDRLRMNKLILLTNLISLSLLFYSCDNDTLTYIQHIESPDRQSNICLYKENTGADNVEFHILKIEKTFDPDRQINKTDYDWILDRELINNFEESMTYARDPKIELIDNRFLIFSRSDYQFALYDLKLNKDILNINNPWSEWASRNIWAEKGTDYKTDTKDERTDYKLWIKKNLDNKIAEYLKANR
jgi:hypothetical protein